MGAPAARAVKKTIAAASVRITRSIYQAAANGEARDSKEQQRFLRASLEHEHDARDRHCEEGL